LTGTTEQMTDQDLVEAVLKGEKQSYEALIDRYKNMAYKIALKLLGDADPARDVVQESFIAAYENLERLKKPAAFGSWLHSIVRHRSISLQRKNKINTVSLEYLADAGIEFKDSSGETDTNNEIVNTLRKLLLKLPEKYQEIIELRYMENYSCKKIADFLGISNSAVISRLHYARQRLRGMLRKEGW
jgi:RNA polymerase sigma-70 factor (ECF subfamily)